MQRSKVQAGVQVLVGLVMLVGGATGKLALRHTQSTTAIWVIGAGLTLYGGWRLAGALRGG